jgi:hypothetical protein
MLPETYEPVARAGNHNLGQLQDSVVGGGKAAIIRKFWDFGVGKVSHNKSAKILNLRQTGPLRATQEAIRACLPGASYLVHERKGYPIPA